MTEPRPPNPTDQEHTIPRVPVGSSDRPAAPSTLPPPKEPPNDPSIPPATTSTDGPFNRPPSPPATIGQHTTSTYDGATGKNVAEKTKDIAKSAHDMSEGVRENINAFADNLVKPRRLAGGERSELSEDAKRIGRGVSAATQKASETVLGAERTEKVKVKMAEGAEKFQDRREERRAPVEERKPEPNVVEGS